MISGGKWVMKVGVGMMFSLKSHLASAGRTEIETNKLYRTCEVNYEKYNISFSG